MLVMEILGLNMQKNQRTSIHWVLIYYICNHTAYALKISLENIHSSSLLHSTKQAQDR